MGERYLASQVGARPTCQTSTARGGGFLLYVPIKTNEFETVGSWLERTRAYELTALRSSRGFRMILIGPGVSRLWLLALKVLPRLKYLENYRILGLVSDG